MANFSTPRKSLALVLMAAVALLAGCAGTRPAVSSETATVVALVSPPMLTTASGPPTFPAAATEPSSTDAACFTREDLAALDLETIAAWEMICYRSDAGVDTSIDQRSAVAAIRSLVGEAPRVIAFQEITRMANSPSGDLKVLRFVDERGFGYLVAPLAEKVLEMDPPTSLPAGSGPVRSVEELQQLAEGLVLSQYPPFSEWKSMLDFEVGSKGGGLYFFRWERAIPGAQHMPALAQVGITETGEIFSYLNTLFYLQEGPPYPTPPASG